MKKILFILNYRAGTNLWNLINGMPKVGFAASEKTRAIVGGKPVVNSDVTVSYAKQVINDLVTWQGTEYSFFLPTNPPNLCPCETYFQRNIETSLSTSPPFEFFSWHVHIGDWWGHSTSATVPDPYEVVTPVRFGPDELKALPGNNWRFVYIVRDGRNQIESLRNIPGGIEQERHREDPKDYFEVLCKAFRNRARLAVDAEAQLPNFRIFKFEAMVANPLLWMQNVYDFIGLPLDRDFVQRAFDLTVSSGAAKKHSSFQSRTGFNERWHAWTDWERGTFDRIAGQELLELGYY